MSAESLYMQIKNKIKERILAGEFKPGEKIPSERELCDEFEVSRITVRKAISEAINDGLLFTVQGKGTFVTKEGEQPKIDQGLSEVTSFEKTIANKGLSAETEILSYDIKPADIVLAKMLNIDINEPVAKLSLLGLAEKRPFVLYRSYFKASIGNKFYEGAITKEENNEAFSTVDLYEEVDDFNPAYVEQTFEAVSADVLVAETMDINEGAPLFRVCSVIYTEEDKPIEYKKAFYRSDKYKFHVKRDI